MCSYNSDYAPSLFLLIVLATCSSCHWPIETLDCECSLELARLQLQLDEALPPDRRHPGPPRRAAHSHDAHTQTHNENEGNTRDTRTHH